MKNTVNIGSTNLQVTKHFMFSHITAGKTQTMALWISHKTDQICKKCCWFNEADHSSFNTSATSRGAVGREYHKNVYITTSDSRTTHGMVLRAITLVIQPKNFFKLVMSCPCLEGTVGLGCTVPLCGGLLLFPSVSVICCCWQHQVWVLQKSL